MSFGLCPMCQTALVGIRVSTLTYCSHFPFHVDLFSGLALIMVIYLVTRNMQYDKSACLITILSLYFLLLVEYRVRIGYEDSEDLPTQLE
jgi:hypothetical protein